MFGVIQVSEVESGLGLLTLELLHVGGRGVSGSGGGLVLGVGLGLGNEVLRLVDVGNHLQKKKGLFQIKMGMSALFVPLYFLS